MRKVFIYGIIFIIISIVTISSAVAVERIFGTLIKKVRDPYEVAALGLLLRDIQVTIGLIGIYALIKKIYSSRSTFFRGLVVGAIFALVDNGIVYSHFLLLFFGYTPFSLIFVLVVYRCLLCFILGQVLAFTYDYLVERFLKPSVSPNTAEL